MEMSVCMAYKQSIIATDGVPKRNTITTPQYKNLLLKSLNCLQKCTRRFCKIIRYRILMHLAYSTDLNPRDFDLFSKLKEPLERCVFSCWKVSDSEDSYTQSERSLKRNRTTPTSLANVH